jgi:hypothetical protein
VMRSRTASSSTPPPVPAGIPGSVPVIAPEGSQRLRHAD